MLCSGNFELGKVEIKQGTFQGEKGDRKSYSGSSESEYKSKSS